MANSTVSFWRVATRAKYIGGLLIALVAAAAFSLAGQWQLDRSFTKDQVSATSQQIVSVDAQLDVNNVFIVENRVQNDELVFWLIANSFTADDKSLTMAIAQTDSLLKAEAARFDLQNRKVAQAFLPVKGYWLPTEAPLESNAEKPYLLKTVSTAQLVNLYSPDKAIASYADFFVASGFAKTLSPALGEINAVLEPAPSINWLSVFYAAEWVLFAGFAIFLWARTVKDAVDAERLN